MNENSVNRNIKILFLASEADPFIKVGGLGDVAGSLPSALSSIPSQYIAGASFKIWLIIPFHNVINSTRWNFEKVIEFILKEGNKKQKVTCYKTHWSGLDVFFISGKPISKWEKVYSLNTTEDGEKYTFFSLAALELCRRLDWKPNIVHANDWHTALAIHQLAALKKKSDPFFAQTRSVITIHNLPFMGGGTEATLREYGITPSTHPLLPDWARYFPLPMGLASVDRIVAVSKSYASEIMTPAFGCGLENFLSSRKSTISGIINGLDDVSWNPEKDSLILSVYSKVTLDKRTRNKIGLQKEMNLDIDVSIPLITLISRMDRQKGIALALDSLYSSIALPWQVIMLGSGDPDLESRAHNFKKDIPDRVRVITRFDSDLSHRLYSGADILFMPSLYEPCGLSQLIGMRYGCLPVAHAVGGLKDTIKPGRTGFLFNLPNPSAAKKSLKNALISFEDKSIWKSMQIEAMNMDFSWLNSAKKYADIYLDLEDGNGI